MIRDTGYTQKRKLEIDDIPLIRGLIECEIPVPEIAEKFDVSKATIYRIKSWKIWSHITEVAR
tara:strand:- start:13322 stop:13510 length:189 start_codon:yes stop_codon:yes gene_type:complete